MSYMANSLALLRLLLLLLLLPLSSLSSEQEISSHQAPAAPPAPPLPPPRPSPPHSQGLLQDGQTANLKAKEMHKDTAKVGLFIAASVGTFFLMAAVYCIYNKFYTKQQYLHMQLHDDSDVTADPADPPAVFFHVSADPGVADLRRAGYGSLSDAPSVISVPPSLSPPLTAIPFPPLFLSSCSLRIISASDLQKKSCS